MMTLAGAVCTIMGKRYYLTRLTAPSYSSSCSTSSTVERYDVVHMNEYDILS